MEQYPRYDEMPLFGNDRLHAYVWFSHQRGWRWQVAHYDGGDWLTLDEGVTRSWTGALHQVQRVVGELDQL